MKLRNKITNEICDAEAREDGIYLKTNWGDGEKWHKYGMGCLGDNWEYYEEPKDYWFIAGRGDAEHSLDRGDTYDIKHKEMGNYFETKEEAEKAAEKLKAWKRLKDAGFVFCGKGDCLDTIKFDYGECGYNRQDFALLFGEEEE